MENEHQTSVQPIWLEEGCLHNGSDVMDFPPSLPDAMHVPTWAETAVFMDHLSYCFDCEGGPVSNEDARQYLETGFAVEKILIEAFRDHSDEYTYVGFYYPEFVVRNAIAAGWEGPPEGALIVSKDQRESLKEIAWRRFRISIGRPWLGDLAHKE